MGACRGVPQVRPGTNSLLDCHQNLGAACIGLVIFWILEPISRFISCQQCPCPWGFPWWVLGINRLFHLFPDFVRIREKLRQVASVSKIIPHRPLRTTSPLQRKKKIIWIRRIYTTGGITAKHLTWEGTVPNSTQSMISKRLLCRQFCINSSPFLL